METQLVPEAAGVDVFNFWVFLRIYPDPELLHYLTKSGYFQTKTGILIKVPEKSPGIPDWCEETLVLNPSFGTVISKHNNKQECIRLLESYSEIKQAMLSCSAFISKELGKELDFGKYHLTFNYKITPEFRAFLLQRFTIGTISGFILDDNSVDLTTTLNHSKIFDIQNFISILIDYEALFLYEQI